LIQRLCISFAGYATAYSTGHAQIRFPFGWCKVEVHGTILDITTGAEDLSSLERVETMLKERLKRIARRSQGELKWGLCESERLHVG